MKRKIFERTGLYIDLRIQVIRPKALCKIAEDLASMGHNTLIIEWEASYPFERHPTICNRYAYGRDEVQQVISHCENLGITVIPLQQCFGHLEYILKHPRYAHLREDGQDFSQLCPCMGDEAVALFSDLFADMAAMHPSAYFHLGGDETRLLGHCPRCRKVAESEGISRLYVNYFKRLSEVVVKLGKRPIFWADILLKHPEASSDMPAQSVFMDWNYGWPVDQFGSIDRLKGIVQRAGFELWGAPALRCHPDNHSLTGWETHLKNLRDYPVHARQNGYSGLITTSWSTSGTYDYIRDEQSGAVDLVPVRRVYPLSGFRILIEAFTAAIECVAQDMAFAPEHFVKGYAKSRFGLSIEQSQALWEVFLADATPVSEAQDIEVLLQRVQHAADLFRNIEGQKHVEELEHLRLMTDLRAFHVRVAASAAKIRDTADSASGYGSECVEAESASRDEQLLNERFLELNAEFLLADELMEEIAYRSSETGLLLKDSVSA